MMITFGSPASGYNNECTFGELASGSLLVTRCFPNATQASFPMGRLASVIIPTLSCPFPNT